MSPTIFRQTVSRLTKSASIKSYRIEGLLSSNIPGLWILSKDFSTATNNSSYSLHSLTKVHSNTSNNHGLASPVFTNLPSPIVSEFSFASRPITISTKSQSTASAKTPESDTSKESEVTVSDYWGIQPKKLYREDGTEWPWSSFKPSDAYIANTSIDLDKHHESQNFGDTFARLLVKSMRWPTDIFFQRRYGCRAMMLETVAAVPGMVAGMLLHLRSLRKFEHTGGWIKTLLEEAENERMHLMTFMEVAQPKWYERALVLTVQGIFFNAYFISYILSPRIAHRVVGYLEEEAIHSYTEFLKEIDAGRIENVPAPAIAIDYWRLPKDATLRDVVEVVRADEAHHRDVNHFAASIIQVGKELKDNRAPMDYH